MMKVLTLLFSGLVATTLAKIKKDPVVPGDISTYVPVHPMADNSTYGNIDQIEISHQHIDWFVNWTSNQFQGSILFDMVVKTNNVLYIQLDSWNNTIDSVQLLPGGSAMRATLGSGNIPVVDNPLVWEVKYPNPTCGDVLVIQLPHAYNRGGYFSIQVLYQTSPTSMGVTWLTPAQTSGGIYPFVFTYSQDINGRAIAPQMDTPAQRITWGGCITTDSFMSPYMSGNFTGLYQSALGYRKTCFYQQIPAANYLMAVVVGDLAYQEMGPTTGLIAEPVVLATAAQEFSNLQAILDTTEAYVQTPYIWGNYTIIVMPPAFPMGGMSNPNLVYTSITTITGDKSQEYVLTRNVAQSWTGNQVTPNNWEDYWMNEGITTFIERHVEAQLFTVSFAETEAYVGNNSLATATGVIGLPDETYVSLHPVLMGDNPDNSFTIAPFEKGFQFLQFIEDFVLGYYWMEDFITYYIAMNNLSSINAFTGFRKTFSNFIETYWKNGNRVNQILSTIWYEEWIYPVGPDPTGLLSFNNTASWNAKSLALAYIALQGNDSPAGYQAYHTWYSNQQVVFHQTLLQNINTDLAIIQKIDSDLDITSQTDPEVRQRWYAIGLYLNYDEVYTPAQTWVSSMGRNKYLNSIYEALTESGQVALGRTWYYANINFYSPTSKVMIEQILGITQ